MTIKVGDLVTFRGTQIVGRIISLDDVDCYVKAEDGVAWWGPTATVVLIEASSPAPPAAPCPECHGRGAVILFTSVSACSRGCGR